MEIWGSDMLLCKHMRNPYEKKRAFQILPGPKWIYIIGKLKLKFTVK
jgi:hypothetical protein